MAAKHPIPPFDDRRLHYFLYRGQCFVEDPAVSFLPDHPGDQQDKGVEDRPGHIVKALPFLKPPNIQIRVGIRLQGCNGRSITNQTYLLKTQPNNTGG